MSVDIEKILETRNLQDEILLLREVLDKGDAQSIINFLEEQLKRKEGELSAIFMEKTTTSTIKAVKASTTTANKKTTNGATKSRRRSSKERQFDAQSILLTAKDSGITENQFLKAYGVVGGDYGEAQKFLKKLLKDGMITEEIGQRKVGNGAYKEIEVLVATTKLRNLSKQHNSEQQAA